MTTFSINTNDLNSSNSLLISGIAASQANAEIAIPFLGNLPALVLAAPADLNGDGNNDLFGQITSPSSATEFSQQQFVIFGNTFLPAGIDLADLNGSNGFIFSDDLAFLSNFNDIDGDGSEDLSFIVPDLDGEESLVSVLFGNNQFSATTNLNTINGTNGFVVTSGNSSVLSSDQTLQGDINNDGIDDFVFVVTSELIDPTTAEEPAEPLDPLIPVEPTPVPDIDQDESEIRVVFGPEIFTANFDIDNLDGSNGFTIDNPVTLSGELLDVTADDFDDLIFTNDLEPEVTVVFGQNQFSAELDLGNLAVGEGLAINDSSTTSSDRLNGSLIADINGDGTSEILIQRSSPNNFPGTEFVTNQTFVVFGSENFIQSSLDLASISNDPSSNIGFAINSAAELATTLDINGDSLEDLVFQDSSTNQTFVVFGAATLPSNLDLNSLDGSNGFIISNSTLESDIVGDVNGDNIDDLVISSTTETDSSFVLLGSQEGFASSIDLSSSTANALEISGTEANNGIADLSDLNGDGIDEIILNPVSNAIDTPSATSRVILGDADNFITEATATNIGLSDSDQNPNTIELFRFRNNNFETGAFVFVEAEEGNNILNDPTLNQIFTLDGQQADGSVNPAFTASAVPGENLIPFFRLVSLENPGTFLYATAEEVAEIFAEDSAQINSFARQGLNELGEDIPEFYATAPGTGTGEEINQLQNNQNGTFLFTDQVETAAIESNILLADIFTNQGVAFESLSPISLTDSNIIESTPSEQSIFATQDTSL